MILIKDVKVKVGSRQKFLKPESGFGDEVNRDEIIDAEGLRIYLLINSLFTELDDDETVEECMLEDGDKLFLLSYRWLSIQGDVIVRKTGAKLQGVEGGDTVLGIKLRVQDQMGLQVGTLNVFEKRSKTGELKYYFYKGEQSEGLGDEEKPLTGYPYNLIVITDEELQAEAPKMAAEWKAEQKERKSRNARSAKR